MTQTVKQFFFVFLIQCLAKIFRFHFDGSPSATKLNPRNIHSDAGFNLANSVSIGLTAVSQKHGQQPFSV